MPKGGLQFWHLIVVVLLAAMLGTICGDLLGRAFPGSSLGQLLSAGVRVGTSAPLDLDIRVAQLTIGVSLRLTVLGALGAGLALVIFFRRV